MKTLGTILLGSIIAGGASLHAADHQFKEVVRAISDEFEAKPMHIPLMGLVNFAAYIIRPAGAKHVDIAIWEDLGDRETLSRVMAERIRTAVGTEWSPFVQTYTNREGHDELVLVFMRPEGKDMKLLVTTIEPNEAVVVQIRLNPDGLKRWIHDPVSSALHVRHKDEE